MAISVCASAKSEGEGGTERCGRTIGYRISTRSRLEARSRRRRFPNPKLDAIQGPLWIAPRSLDAAPQEELMATMQTIESESTLVGASAHIIGVARKPTD